MLLRLPALAAAVSLFATSTAASAPTGRADVAAEIARAKREKGLLVVPARRLRDALPPPAGPMSPAQFKAAAADLEFFPPIAVRCDVVDGFFEGVAVGQAGSAKFTCPLDVVRLGNGRYAITCTPQFVTKTGNVEALQKSTSVYTCRPNELVVLSMPGDVRAGKGYVVILRAYD